MLPDDVRTNELARSSGRDPRLLWNDSDGEQELQLRRKGPPIMIGRASGADLRLIDSLVSRHHAEVSYAADIGNWQIRDGGSRNGTFVAGERIRSTRVLDHGDHIRCGKTVIELDWPDRVRMRPPSSQPDTVGAPPPPALSAGEIELLRELCRPFRRSNDPRTASLAPPSNPALAESLHLTEDGVRGRLKRLYPKFGLDGQEADKRHELVALAFESGSVRRDEL